MAVKVVAIGNQLMGDDGIGLKVAERLRRMLEGRAIEVVVSETDTEYGLCRIEEGDVVFILDATNYGLPAGTVTACPAGCEHGPRSVRSFTHSVSLVDLLRTQVRFVRGYFIGIEVEEIGFSLELSEELQKAFDEICIKVWHFILEEQSRLNDQLG